MDSKKPWQSKTLLLNGIGGLILFAALFVPAAASWGDWLKSNSLQIGVAWSVLNMVLRAITKDKLQLSE